MSSGRASHSSAVDEEADLCELTAGLFIFAFTPGRTHWMGPVIGLFLVSLSNKGHVLSLLSSLAKLGPIQTFYGIFVSLGEDF